MLYTTLDLFLAEIIGIGTALVMNHLLAKKDRRGWFFYLLTSIAFVYLLAFKDSWMSVCNQTMMGILAIKNYYLFYQPQHKWHRYFDWLTYLVFLYSLTWISGFDGKSLSEVALWITIIGKTLLLGKMKIGGWYFQIVQNMLSIAFGWYRNMYLYVIESAIFTIQGIYGLLQWKKQQSINQET